MSSWLSLTFVVHILDSKSPRFCLQCLSFHFPQSKKRSFLTVSTPGCHLLYLNFLTPLAICIILHFMCHWPVSHSQIEKRRNKWFFPWYFTQRQLKYSVYSRCFTHAWCVKGHQSNWGNLSIVFLSLHKLWVFVNPPNQLFVKKHTVTWIIIRFVTLLFEQHLQ